MTPTSEQQENGERHHIDVQSTPSYPPPSPPVNTRRQYVFISDKQTAGIYNESTHQIKTC